MSTAHNCGKELGAGVKDGERRTCSCGRTWEWIRDDSLGSYWVPQIKQPHNKEASRLKARKMRFEAQSVGGLFPKRQRRKA